MWHVVTRFDPPLQCLISNQVQKHPSIYRYRTFSCIHSAGRSVRSIRFGLPHFFVVVRLDQPNVLAFSQLIKEKESGQEVNNGGRSDGVMLGRQVKYEH